MLGVVLVNGPDVLEGVSVALVGEALDQPVDSWVEEALVLVVRQVGMTCLDNAVVQLEHVLDHQEEVVLAGGIQRITYSGQVGASVGRTERLSDASNHLG